MAAASPISNWELRLLLRGSHPDEFGVTLPVAESPLGLDSAFDADRSGQRGTICRISGRAHHPWPVGLG